MTGAGAGAGLSCSESDMLLLLPLVVVWWCGRCERWRGTDCGCTRPSQDSRPDRYLGTALYHHQAAGRLVLALVPVLTWPWP